jgi:hypothetical protein
MNSKHDDKVSALIESKDDVTAVNNVVVSEDFEDKGDEEEDGDGNGDGDEIDDEEFDEDEDIDEEEDHDRDRDRNRNPRLSPEEIRRKNEIEDAMEKGRLLAQLECMAKDETVGKFDFNETMSLHELRIIYSKLQSDKTARMVVEKGSQFLGIIVAGIQIFSKKIVSKTGWAFDLDGYDEEFQVFLSENRSLLYEIYYKYETHFIEIDPLQKFAFFFLMHMTDYGVRRGMVKKVQQMDYVGFGGQGQKIEEEKSDMKSLREAFLKKQKNNNDNDNKDDDEKDEEEEKANGFKQKMLLLEKQTAESNVNNIKINRNIETPFIM